MLGSKLRGSANRSQDRSLSGSLEGAFSWREKVVDPVGIRWQRQSPLRLLAEWATRTCILCAKEVDLVGIWLQRLIALKNVCRVSHSEIGFVVLLYRFLIWLFMSINLFNKRAQILMCRTR